MGSDPGWQQKMVERFLMLEEEKEEKISVSDEARPKR